MACVHRTPGLAAASRTLGWGSGGEVAAVVRCGMVRDVVQCGAVLSSGHGVMCMQCTCSVHVVYM